MNDNQILIRRIVKNAIVLALYVALTFASSSLAFGANGGIQFRVSELLILLCFFNRDYVIGITLGCFLCNLASPFMPWDLLIGTGATLIAALAISFMKHLGIAVLIPIITNSFLIAIEYEMFEITPYWLGVGFIALGETVVIIISYILCLFIMKKEAVLDLIDAKRNRDFKW